MIPMKRFCTSALAAIASVSFLISPFAITPAAGQRAGLETEPTSISPNDLPAEKMEETQRNIARVTAKLLEQSHFSRMPLDDGVSQKFLNRYLDTLDGLHLYFLQSDMEEFSKFQFVLDDLITRRGDTSPGRLIFSRFRERVDQRVSYALELLKNGEFKFEGSDRYMPDRDKAPRPKDLDEARNLWKQHLRSEFLQEKLASFAATNLFTGTNSALTPEKKAELAFEKLNGSEYSSTNTAAIVKKLSQRYTRLQKTIKDMGPNEVFEYYLTALSHVYDPHSDYMGHSQLENFAIGMKLSLFGIGALLGAEEGYCEIKELVPGGPAERSKKLKPKDKIVAVAQGEKEPVDVYDMPLSKIVEMIRGPKGTEVRLVVQPVGASDVRKTITLVRDEIPLINQEAKAKIIETAPGQTENKRLGIIDLPSFYADFGLNGESKSRKERKSTTVDVARLLKKLKEEKVAGIILDLRRNGGGSLEEAINLTGLFIPKGPVVQTRDSLGEVNVGTDDDPAMLYDGPLIVLTSKFSASASEILAGALQDYGRALIVGDSSTHGKGTVQSLVQLGPLMEQARLSPAFDPGALKVTVRKFYRAGGASTQLRGIVPDIILPSLNNHADYGEASLDNPLPWDEVPAAKFTRIGMVEQHLTQLKKASEQRVNSEKDYTYLKEDIERFKKIMADKSVSLNEKQRLMEKFENDERDRDRKTERKKRKESAEKIYEITLKNVEQPGLPAPAAKTNEVSAALSSSLETGTGDDGTELLHGGEDKPAVDVTMEEAKRILEDYVDLIRKALVTRSARN